MKTDKKYIINNISSQYYLKLLNKFQNQRKNFESLKLFKASSSNNTYNKSKSEIPYSIKPLFCSVPKDVNMHKILVNMMNSSFKINGNKSIYVKISEEDLKIRSSILNNIKSFINNNSISKRIFCAIIFLYDILYIKNLEQELLASQEEIGIGAILLTMKFIYGKTKALIKNFSSIFPCLEPKEQSNKIKINEIEIKSLKLINYYLSYASPISFMEIFFINGIIFSTDNIKTEQSGRIYELVIDIIEKIMNLSNEYIKYNPLCLCSCVVAFAREIHYLEKWPQILTQAFGVNFSSFENIYNEFHEYIISNKNNENDLGNNNINKINKQRSQTKLDNEKALKYLYNKFNSSNFYETGMKKRKDIYQIKSFSDNYKDDNNEKKEYNCSNNKNNKFEDNDMEVPSLSEKKGFIFKSLFGNKINENNKVNRHIIFNSSKEEDYSNAATAENSNNYNKNNLGLNQEKNNNNSNTPPDFKENENNNLHKTSSEPYTSQKKNIKKYERWYSIKKICKMKSVEEPKESFYPCTEMKYKKNNL